MIKLQNKNSKFNFNSRLTHFKNFGRTDFSKALVRFFTFAVLLMPFYLLSGQTLFAQNDENVNYTEQKVLTKDIVPPPLNFVSTDERIQLKAESKLKNRTDLALELMEQRLLKSEEFLKNDDFQQSLNQLGNFQGLLIYTLDFLKESQHQKSSLKSFKKVEINLRDFMPRLELIRREMPFKYSYHIQKLMVYVRDSRTDALDPMFGNTVLNEGGN